MILQRLHDKYVTGELNNDTCLRYYLHQTNDLRNSMIKILIGDEEVDPNHECFQLKVRLRKFPIGTYILADRGFAFDVGLYPNLNKHLTPYFLLDREQFSTEELSKDLITCQLRYSAEAVFRRITDVKSVAGIVEYPFSPIFIDCHSWAHGRANLCKPWKQPRNYKDGSVGI